LISSTEQAAVGQSIFYIKLLGIHGKEDLDKDLDGSTLLFCCNVTSKGMVEELRKQGRSKQRKWKRLEGNRRL
jgi:hypothetical protein